MEFVTVSEAYITIKDHKENFPEKPSFALINPSNSDIEKFSKSIFDQIKQNISQSTNVNHWKNNTSAIDWFKAINNKLFVCLFMISKAFIHPDFITRSIWESTQVFKANNTYCRQRFENYDAFQKNFFVPLH